MVCAHYILVEKIKYEDRVQNEIDLAVFVLGWHFVFMFFKNAEESRRKKNEDVKLAYIILVVLFVSTTILTCILTPILAWFNVEITNLQTNYWSLRYLMMFFYITFNIIINVFPLVNNFLFFLSDGIILSQITSIYLINEFSMSALLTVLPFLFVLQNHGLIKGIKNFPKDETNSKLSFVRLIGRHDAVFLFVIYTLFTFLFNFVDFISTDYHFGINFWYLIYAIYIFGKLMEDKKISALVKFVSFLSVVIYTGVYLYTL
jgi:hypothetical protein